MLRRHLDPLALTATVLLSGCPESSGPCARIGSLNSCTEACVAAGGGCNERLSPPEVCGGGVCMPVWSGVDLLLSPEDGRRGPLLCSPLPGSFWTHQGAGACRFDDRFPAGGMGLVVSEPDCDAAFAATGIPCWWSDGTMRTRSPPPSHARCPIAPDPAPTLCGGPCGDCDSHFFDTQAFLPEDGFHRLACYGRNDERDIGVCGFDSCSRGDDYFRCPVPRQLEADWADTRCLCLSPSGTDTGWVVPESGCRAYRELYPGTFDCRDETWTAVP